MANTAQSMIAATPRGQAPVALSVLDLATVSSGSNAVEALKSTTEVAQVADEYGYHRLWVAEHHSMAGIASSSPAVLLAHLAANTKRIRLGSGGVMLPNHPPLVIAEQFGTLEALYPGRIDLGLGRAPGTDQATAKALRRGTQVDPDVFDQQVAELVGFLDGSFPLGHPYTRIHAVPGPVQSGGSRPPLWLLGSSGYSARLAGRLGLPFAFAHHFSPQNTLPALDLYRESFEASEVLSEPYAMLAASAVAAATTEKAELLVKTMALAMLRVRTGVPGLMPSPQEAAEYPYTQAEAEFCRAWLTNVVFGDGASVRAGIDDLVSLTGVSEVMIAANIYGRESRSDSYRIIADAYGLRDEPVV